jgi:hypothetical protein
LAIFPEETRIRVLAFASRALATTTAAIRSLKDPVGFMVSFFSHRESNPSVAERAGAWSKGVCPSPRVISEFPGVTGRSFS